MLPHASLDLFFLAMNSHFFFSSPEWTLGNSPMLMVDGCFNTGRVLDMAWYYLKLYHSRHTF
jgi:hypothetical protein